MPNEIIQQNNVPISQAIQDILDERNKTAEEILQIKSRIQEAMNATNGLIRIKDEILDAEGNLRTDSPLANLFANSTALEDFKRIPTEVFLTRAKSLMEEYQILYDRFSRDYLTISAIGEAGMGKSKLLQTISGLDNNCIPSFDGDHCTGASTVIHNDDSFQEGQVLAEFVFKTESEMLEEINTELAYFCRGHRYSSLDSLQNSQDTLQNWVDNDGILEKRNNALTFRNRYIDNFNEWRPYVGQNLKPIKDPNEILPFVAQYDGDKRDENGRNPKFFRFVAVKKGTITTKFSHNDVGKIMLVDTEGLGANSELTEKNVVNTVKRDSDVVIFIHMPAKRKMQVNQGEQEFLAKIVHDFEHLSMENWFFVLVNHIEPDNAQATQVDLFNCENYKSYISDPIVGLNQHIGMIEIVNASKRDSVINAPDSFMMKVLEHMRENLRIIDDEYIKATENVANAAFESYQSVIRALSKVTSQLVTGNATDFDQTDSIISLRNTMLQLVSDYVIKRFSRQDYKCEAIDYALGSVTGRVTMRLPSAADIDQYAQRNNINQPSVLYMQVLNWIRNEVAYDYSQVNAPLHEFIAVVKDDIAACLLSEEGGRLGRLLGDAYADLSPSERLEALCAERLDPDRYPVLRNAIDYLLQFDLDVNSSLIFGVRQCMQDYSMFNPNLAAVKTFPERPPYGQSVSFYLRSDLNNMQQSLQSVCDQFSAIPCQAAYALCDYFYDQIRYAAGAGSEWNRLYQSVVGVIWRDELAEAAEGNQAFGRWNDMAQALQHCNHLVCFKYQREKGEQNAAV